MNEYDSVPFADLMRRASFNNSKAQEMLDSCAMDKSIEFRLAALEAEEKALRIIIGNRNDDAVLTKFVLCMSASANCLALMEFDKGLRITQIGLSDTRMTAQQRKSLGDMATACIAMRQI